MGAWRWKKSRVAQGPRSRLSTGAGRLASSWCWPRWGCASASAGRRTRAHARGDLRDNVDRDLILDLIGSFVHYRALFRHAPISDTEIERVVEALLQGIATDYPSLLEHSRSISGDSRMHRLHG
jgi:Tetracyclin repressor-like, C-terminal domain